MSCSQSTLLFHFVTEPGSDEGLAFARHLPACSICRRRVELWDRIEERLGVSERFDASDHPSPETLLQLHELGVEGHPELQAPHAHVEACESCQAEIRALRRFNFVEAGRVAAEAHGEVEATAPESEAQADARAGSSFDWLRPAWIALGVAAAVAVVIWMVRPPGEGTRGGPPSMVERSRPSAPTTEDDASGLDALQLAEQVDPGANGDAAGSSGLDRGASEVGRETSPLVASAQPERPSAMPAPGPPPEEAAEGVVAGVDDAEPAIVAEWQLAAAGDLGVPAYVRPSAAEPFSFEPMLIRTEGGGRFDEALILVPDHVALTTRASPRLYWQTDRRVDVDVEVTVVRHSDGFVALEYVVQAPIEPGLHVVDLPEHRVVIEEDAEYRLYLSAITDPARRARDRRAAAAIRRIAPPSGLPGSNLEAARAGTSLGHAAAADGLWLDALDFFIEAGAREPNGPEVKEMRDGLLESAGLAPIGT